jgi:hypothetical protein
MKATTPLLVGTLLLGAICWVPESANAQTGIPVLVGSLNDGTPPPPPPPQPPLDTGPVREIKEFQLREGTASLCRVPSPRRGMIQAASTAASELPRTSAFPTDLTTRRLLMQERYRRQRLVVLTATVYDHRWSFVRWHANGAGNRNFAAWSNVDFNHFTGIGGFDLSGLRFSFFMPVTNQDTVRLKARMEAAGGQYVPPQPPDLPPWEPAFVLVEGDPTDADGILPVKGLHDLYKIERFRLAAAFQGRERARLAQATWLKANPPSPKHYVLYHYAVQPAKIHPQRLEGGPR